MPKPRLVCDPLTPDRWADFETLFGERGACGGCWCTFWRRPRAAVDAHKRGGNPRFMLSAVNDGPPPRLLRSPCGGAGGWGGAAPRTPSPPPGPARLLLP